MIDKWGISPGAQIPEFMERSVRENDFVLIVCTPNYRIRSNQRLGGVGYEGNTMSSEVLAYGKDEKFIPLLRFGEWRESASSWLLGKSYLDFRGDPYDEDAYQDLLANLFGKRKLPRIGKPPKFGGNKSFIPKQLRDACNKYLQYLIEANSYIDPRGIMQTRRSVALKLDDVYVSLNIEPDVLTIDAGIARRQMLADARNMLGESEAEDKVHTETINEAYLRQEPIELATAVRENTRLIILGDPGTGKTTLLRFLAKQFASCIDKRLVANNERVKDNEGLDYGLTHIPILLRIANYADAVLKNRSLTLRAFILDGFGDVPTSRDDLAAVLEYILDNGKAIILLDGLDEIVEASNRTDIVRRIEQFVAGNTSNQIVVTSRIAGYRESPLVGDFVHFTLRPMDRSQIEKFLHRWCPAAERSLTPDVSIEEIQKRSSAEIVGILTSIDESLGVQRLAANPLMLTIIALIHRNGTRLPSRRVELYELAAKTLLEDWELARGLSRENIVTESEALRLLGPLAYWLHENKPKGVAPEREIKRRLIEILALTRGVTTDDLEIEQAIDDFLRRVRQHTGLLVERAPKQYGFMHLTFEEYFAARELVRRRNESVKRIYEHRHKPRWEEPIVLAISFVSSDYPEDAIDLLRTSILAESEDAKANYFERSKYEDVLHRDLLFAAKVICDCTVLDPVFTNRLVRSLLGIYFDAKGSAKFEPLQDHLVSALRSLGATEVSGFVKHTVSFATTTLQSQESDLRRKAVDVLGILGTGEKMAADDLQLAIRDRDPELRRRAAVALGTLRDGRQEILDSLINALQDEHRSVRICAADALGTIGIGIPALVKKLLPVLEAPEPHVRKKATDALGMLSANSHEAIIGLLQALKNENRHVRRNAANALGLSKVTSDDIADGLVAILRDEDGVVRQHAASSLGILRLENPAAINGLLDLLADKFAGVRASAAEALGALNTKSENIVTKLVANLRDTDPDVRSSTSRALGRLGVATFDVITSLLILLKDEYEYVRGRAAIALGELGLATPEVVSGLLELLGDRNEFVRGSSAEALGILGVATTAVVSGLLAALKDEHEYVRISAAEALGLLGNKTEEGINGLVSALTDNHSYVRVVAASALLRSRIIEANAIRELVSLLKDDLAGVRAMAAQALGKLSIQDISSIDDDLPRTIQETLNKMLYDNDNNERVYVGRYYWQVYSFVWQALWVLTTPY